MSSTSSDSRRSLEAAAWALVAVQVLHGVTPAETTSEGWVGAAGGLILLLAAGVAAVSVRAGLSWGPTAAGWTGLAVAIGFTLYHALPFRSPITNPYPGEPVGVPAWISVALAVSVGFWVSYEGLFRRRDSSPQHP